MVALVAFEKERKKSRICPDSDRKDEKMRRTRSDSSIYLRTKRTNRQNGREEEVGGRETKAEEGMKDEG